MFFIVKHCIRQYTSLQPGETKKKKEDQEIIYTVVEWFMVKYRAGGKVVYNTRKQWK